MSVQVLPITEEQVDDAGRVLAAAMMTEPGYVSILPDAGLRYRILVPLITGTVREAMQHKAAFAAHDGDRLVGVSLWMPPGLYPPPPQPESDVVPEIPPYLRELDPEVLLDLVIFDDRCMSHFPDEPAWYLMYLGIDPSAQGSGIGSTLLRESLAQVLEREEMPVYLETGTQRNVRFYQRFGFQIRESDVQLVPGSIRHWTMIRPARVPVVAGQ